MASKTTLVTVAAVVATGVLAYAVYFDYKRRNDLEFRRKLKKEKKRVNKSVQQSKQVVEEDAPSEVGEDVLREALKALKNEPNVPLEEREAYFMNQISMGETLAAQGPSFYVPAAIAFFRALRIYPAPAELIGIYQTTVHPPVFKLVIEMTNMDVSSAPSPTTATSGPAVDDSLDDVSPERGPPSESGSQEWDKVTDPGTQA
ncbi:hypothetical protein D9611_002674 [Ephemerocybe angulata]|uniref:Uncharacterized protein n=1 Tax=Ephemerocybe angulata TaxID=980116 RepID=A0A8H5C1G5_9AGAR|nr:hypothetical protein D9611_002674 [Tulosesus angulatus]